MWKKTRHYNSTLKTPISFLTGWKKYNKTSSIKIGSRSNPSINSTLFMMLSSIPCSWPHPLLESQLLIGYLEKLTLIRCSKEWLPIRKTWKLNQLKTSRWDLRMWLVWKTLKGKLLNLSISLKTVTGTLKWELKFPKEHFSLDLQVQVKQCLPRLVQDKQELLSFTFLVLNLLRCLLV